MEENYKSIFYCNCKMNSNARVLPVDCLITLIVNVDDSVIVKCSKCNFKIILKYKDNKIFKVDKVDNVTLGEYELTQI